MAWGLGEESGEQRALVPSLSVKMVQELGEHWFLHSL